MSADTPEESPVRPEWVSRRAVAWVIDDAPVPSDLAFTLTVIARRCDQDGKGSFQSKRTMAKAAGKSVDQVQRDVQDLLERKLIRLGDQSLPGKFGIKPGQWPTVYDVALEMKGPKPGKKSKNPSGRKKPAPEPTEDTPRMDATPCMEARGGMEAPGTPRMDAPSTPRMDAPQRDPSKNPSNNPSSLSARTSVTAAREDADDRERDESASPEDPNLTWHQRLVVEAGCPPHRAVDVSVWLQAKFPDKGPGWWRKVQSAGDLRVHIQDALDALAEPTPDDGTGLHCPTCRDTGKVTIRLVHEGDREKTTDCPDCTNDGRGGCRIHPGGRSRRCGGCRADRHAADNEQPRSSQRGQLVPTRDSRPAAWQQPEPAEARKARGWLDLEID